MAGMRRHVTPVSCARSPLCAAAQPTRGTVLAGTRQAFVTQGVGGAGRSLGPTTWWRRPERGAWTARVLTRHVLHGTFLCHELNIPMLHGHVVIWHTDAPGAYRDTVYGCPSF